MGEASKYLTTGLAAVEIGGGLQGHHVDRLCRRGLVPHSRCGRLKLIAVSDLGAVRAAAARAGYVRGERADRNGVSQCRISEDVCVMTNTEEDFQGFLPADAMNRLPTPKAPAASELEARSPAGWNRTNERDGAEFERAGA